MRDAIGNTPLVQVRQLDTGPCELFLKCEHRNPGGSIKDRIAWAMVEAAEQSGVLKPGGAMVEATAGNTGLALAQVAIARGYKLKLVIPDKMSREKIDHLRALGVEVVMTRSDVSRGDPEYYQDYAERLAAEDPNAWYVDQFSNPANPLAHEQTTGPEIWQQMDERLDVVVSGAGTGGHVTGVGRFMKRVAPHVRFVLADPYGSVLGDTVDERNDNGEHEKWLVEGIGQDYVPKTCNLELVQEVIRVNDQDAFTTARALAQKEGIFAGSSTGLVVQAALQFCRAQTEPKRVVTFVYDTGDKYLSKVYNDDWMRDKGLLT